MLALCLKQLCINAAYSQVLVPHNKLHSVFLFFFFPYLQMSQAASSLLKYTFPAMWDQRFEAFGAWPSHSLAGVYYYEVFYQGTKWG